MQFHIDQDSGAIISGWIAPDNPSTTPRVRVSVPGRPDFELNADLPRPDIQALGLHSTGNTGFGIDEANTPGLASFSEVSVREADSGVLIYRRCSNSKPLKLFVFDTTVNTENSCSLYGCLAPHFALTYVTDEHYAFDTLFSILNNRFSRSILASGQLPIARYENVFQANDFVRAAIIRHPFETLAFKLCSLRELNARRTSNFALDLLEFADSVASVPAVDPAEVQARLRRLSPASIAQIANPLIKAFACPVDEVPNRAHIAVALDRLASFDLVGTHSDHGAFLRHLTERAEVSLDGALDLGLSATTSNVASAIARIESVRKLLALDLSLYAYVEDALSLAKRSQTGPTIGA